MGKFSKAIAAVKDHTSIRLARAGNQATISDLDVAIMKSTCHDEYPAEECHIQQILTLTSDSPLYVASCVNTISQRLNKTRNWVVALKTLMLIQRVLQEGNPKYEHEIFFATRRGTRLLNMSDFRDALRSSTWDYAAFVRSYALFLDERLEYKMQGKRGTHSLFSQEEDFEENIQPEAIVIPVREMNNDQIFVRNNHLMQLLERFLACRPTGEARHHRMVMVALYSILIQSFQIYNEITEVIGVLIERFEELNVQHSVKVYGILQRVAKQYEELEKFFDWCKSVAIARTSEFPEVDLISQKILDSMDERIKEKTAAEKQES